MNVIPIQSARVTNNMQAMSLLHSVRANQAGLLGVQNQLSTGLAFQRPSEDPAAASLTSRFDARLDILGEVSNALRKVNGTVLQAETAVQEVVDTLVDTYTLASEAVSDTIAADERAALAVVVESAIQQLVAVGNREYLGTGLFSGHLTDGQPFVWDQEGVLFRGDDGRLETILDTDLSQETYSISGLELFQAESAPVTGVVDLNPRVTLETRLSDLRGPSGQGLEVGRIQISTAGGDYPVDLGTADTVGDVLDRLNADLPDDLTASLAGNAIQIQSGSGAAFTVSDLSGGRTALELGLATTTPAALVFGGDLDPALTLRTRLVHLNDGAGLTLDNGITIRNGDLSADIDFGGVETIEGLLNRINQSGVGVEARIAADGSSLEIVNRTSGTNLQVMENGGGDATLLGLRTMHADTPLASLNDGLGIFTVDDEDLRITTADGTQVDIDLDVLDLDSATLQDLLDLINTVGGGAVTADFVPTGNGLRLTDNTAGPGTLRVEALNLSQAVQDLGLATSSAGGVLLGGDVNPIRVDSAFTALLELRDALLANDTRAITAAAERLDRNLDNTLAAQGRLAATASTLLQREERVANETSATEILRSDVRDADLTESVIRFQQLQTALQANLSSAAQLQNLSLLDFL